VIALVGGLSVLLGYHTRLGAWLLVIFLVPVTLVMHNFWSISDPMTLQIQKAMFMKNLAMIGGALVIGYFGADPLSLDALISQRRNLIRE
jgi:putative oxidoreductase